MHVCQRLWCDFCVWSPQFLVIIRIFRDDAFLAGVLPKLRDFYFSHLLPALSAESLLFLACLKCHTGFLQSLSYTCIMNIRPVDVLLCH